MSNDERPDYFSAAPSVEDAVLRGIKGNCRRQMVIKNLLTEDLASVPEPWQAHDISENLNDVLTSAIGPQGPGAGRLPPLQHGVLDVCALRVVFSVHAH